MEIRTGTGFDVHRLTEGRRLVLCGVDIPYDRGLFGHSDADAATHALIDAMLGAAAMGDIGRLFPDSDPAYEGCRSLELLKDVTERISAAGFTVANADITIICDRPKLAGYTEAMRRALADIISEGDTGRISVKATTTEGLGCTGRGEGIAAQAACLLTRG